jgi:hypothetical protein
VLRNGSTPSDQGFSSTPADRRSVAGWCNTRRSAARPRRFRKGRRLLPPPTPGLRWPAAAGGPARPREEGNDAPPPAAAVPRYALRWWSTWPVSTRAALPARSQSSGWPRSGPVVVTVSSLVGWWACTGCTRVVGGEVLPPLCAPGGLPGRGRPRPDCPGTNDAWMGRPRGTGWSAPRPCPTSP